jgi:hypothetical protein
MIPAISFRNILLLILLAIDVNSPNQDSKHKGQEYKGDYINSAFGFSVQIPDTMVGLGSAIGAPNHGFRIYFSDSDDYLIVVGSYDTAELSDIEPNYQVAPKGFIVLDSIREKAKLGGQETEQLRQKLKRKKDGTLYVKVTIGMLRSVNNRRCDYSITLLTPDRHYSERYKIYERLVGSFHLLP